MRLEVFVDEQGSKTYDLDKSEVLIGSGSECDIVLNVSGVSKKHLTVSQIGGTFFVIDHDSANGSYVDDLVIEPGEGIEVSPAKPVRLGTKVLLTVLADEETSDVPEVKEPTGTDWKTLNISLAERDKTVVISLEDIKKTKTKKLVKKKKTIEKKKKRKTSASSSSSDSSLRVILLIVGAFMAYHYYKTELAPSKLKGVLSAPKRAVKSKPNKVPVAVVDFTPRKLFEDPELIQSCLSQGEAELCRLHEINFPQSPFWVFLEGQILNVMTTSHAPVKSAQELCSYNGFCEPEELNLLTYLVFIRKLFPMDFDLNPYLGLTFNFIFMEEVSTESLPQLRLVAGVKGARLKELLTKLNESDLQNVRRIGPLAVVFAKTLSTLQMVTPYSEEAFKATSSPEASAAEATTVDESSDPNSNPDPDTDPSAEATPQL